MENILNQIVEYLNSIGYLGALLGCLVILVESIIPVVPLMLFITLNFYVFGNILGFIMSWVFTCIGCTVSYLIFKNGFGNKFEYLTKDKEKINKYKKSFKNISLTNLILLIAIPFTPAFLVNIVCGLIKMDFKKYIVAILIGKISLVYFWGYIGTSLIESITNPLILIKIIILLLIMFIISKIVTKLLHI